MKNVEVPQENPLVVVKSTKVIAPIASSTEATTKRTFPKSMEIEEEEASSETNKAESLS